MSVLSSPRLTQTADVLAMRAKRYRHALPIPGPLAIAVIVFANLVANALQLALTTPAQVLGGITLVGLCIALAALRWTAALPTTAVADNIGQSGDSKLPLRRGLVMLVGLDSADPKSAAATLFASVPNVEYLALVGTVETGQHGVATELVNRVAPAAGLHAAHVRSWDFGNAESIADAEQATTEAIRWMKSRGLDVAEIVVDVSAGRRAMFIGAIKAADADVVESQYLTSRWDANANKPIPDTKMFKIVETYH